MNLPRPIFILILTLGLAPINPVTGKESNSPNIVFMFADDLVYADLSCYGQPYAKKPYLDRLEASKGQPFYLNIWGHSTHLKSV
ncbi:hypothetical protein N8664_02160 [Verrucomicrobia bacterium]|nr:hypothetical protein [Verrucomicrobiota bacterium]MDB4744233.1 hypothetical protein [Verrucomicrobiota bacterium]